MDPHLTSPFRIFGTVSVAPSGASARTQLSRASEQTCVVTYPGDPTADSPIFIKFGDNSVSAANTDFPMLPETSRAFTLTADQTYIAAFGTGTIYASVGEGV